MNDAPFPQTLPQQLRELGERWGVARLRGLYTSPMGRFVLSWIALIVLLRIAVEISLDAVGSGWNSGWGITYSLAVSLQRCWHSAMQLAAIALVIWFQCRWPGRIRWGVFMGSALGYALFPWAIGVLAYQRAAPFDSAQLWQISPSLFRVATLLFFLRTGNVLVRVFLVDRSTSFSEQKLPAQNSWSLRGMFLVVVLVACFLAIVRTTKERWAPSELFGTDVYLMAFWWLGSFSELLILSMLAYAVAARRIQQQRWIWWLALVAAVAIPWLVTWMYWHFIWPPGPGRPPLRFAPLWIDALVVAFTMVLLEWFFVVCERSGYQLAMWIRGSDDVIPIA